MKAQLLKIIHDSRQYTLSVAEALSQKDYGTSMAKGTMSFGELMNHIAYGIHWWETSFVNGKEIEWSPPAAKSSKKEVIALLSGAFDSLEKSVQKGTDQDQLLVAVWATLDHVTHHRGQAVVHLRKHGIAPPEYVGVSVSQQLSV
ncbi:MAG TPA: DinB family protein [Chryseolinea sp.]|nr:DinB family protein [Chryseolinea sp.]